MYNSFCDSSERTHCQVNACSAVNISEKTLQVTNKRFGGFKLLVIPNLSHTKMHTKKYNNINSIQFIYFKTSLAFSNFSVVTHEYHATKCSKRKDNICIFCCNKTFWSISVSLISLYPFSKLSSSSSQIENYLEKLIKVKHLQCVRTTKQRTHLSIYFEWVAII